MARLVGIDFGSSKSMICAVEDGRPVIVPNAEGSPSTPSVVAFAGNGEVLVGEMARRQAVTNAERTVRLVKRRLGTAWKTEIDGKVFTAPQISAFVLQKLVRDASSYLREQVTDAVVAVPAYFGEAERQAIREAGQMAGLNVRRVIGASEAAALAYYAARRASATILVLGLGGGTFEVSLLEAEEGVVAVKAASGDNHLGGGDWDQRIVDHLVQQAGSAGGVDLSTDQTALQRLREAAEQAKIDLSSAAASEVNVPYIAQSADGPLHLQTTLTRAEFQTMTADLLDRCKDLSEQVMVDARMRAGDIVAQTGPGHRTAAVTGGGPGGARAGSGAAAPVIHCRWLAQEIPGRSGLRIRGGAAAAAAGFTATDVPLGSDRDSAGRFDRPLPHELDRPPRPGPLPGNPLHVHDQPPRRGIREDRRLLPGPRACIGQVPAGDQQRPPRVRPAQVCGARRGHRPACRDRTAACRPGCPGPRRGTHLRRHHDKRGRRAGRPARSGALDRDQRPRGRARHGSHQAGRQAPLTPAGQQDPQLRSLRNPGRNAAPGWPSLTALQPTSNVEQT
jgi:hypothetical protein